MKKKYEQKLSNAETKHIECTHKCENKDCLVKVSKYSYQCLVCGEIIYKDVKKESKMDCINISIAEFGLDITIYKSSTNEWMVKTLGSISFDGSIEEFQHELFKDRSKNEKIIALICSLECGLP